MLHLLHKIGAITLILATSIASAADEWVPERRQSQFQTETGYALFPMPYSLPGIGSGVTAIGAVQNAFNGYTDIYAVVLGGDIRGSALGISEVHLVPEHLFFDLGYTDINRGSFTSYNERGIRSDPDNYTNIEVADINAYGGRLTGSLFQRRLEFYGARYLVSARLKSIRDADGKLIAKAEDGGKIKGGQNIFGGRLDLTDDFSDPRHGLRVDISGWRSPQRGSGPEYTLVDVNTTAYFPMGKRSTWALNYLQSDAHVTRQGETDRTALENELGLNCAAITDTADRAACDEYIDNIIAANRYGNASNLGGFNRLRAYPEGRYHGAHTRFLATEFRWNLTEEFTPFNFYVIKDVRTTFQVAFFLEAGTIADRYRDLWDDIRSVAGVGARVITASGVVFRADIAAGQEGVQPSLWFDYPWEF